MSKLIILAQPPNEGFIPTAQIAYVRTVKTPQAVLVQKWQNEPSTLVVKVPEYCWVLVPNICVDKMEILTPNTVPEPEPEKALIT